MSDLTPSRKGSIAEAKALAALVAAGGRVSVPFDDDCPYDLILDFNGRLFRLQVKWAAMGKRGSIVVPTAWRGDGRGDRQAYAEDRLVDAFVAYCPESDLCYIIPYAEATGRGTSLRVEKPRNNQRAGVRLAEDYELSRMIKKLSTIPTQSPQPWA